MKIIELIESAHSTGGNVVSFEFFPAKTEGGVANLLQRYVQFTKFELDIYLIMTTRIEDMKSTLRPTFVTLTWRSVFKVYI